MAVHILVSWSHMEPYLDDSLKLRISIALPLSYVDLTKKPAVTTCQSQGIIALKPILLYCLFYYKWEGA